ncbi:ABC transporter ATP-binding protein YtrB [Companilactobacillus paralimentarius]|uniref:ATP-binding cassette domain-containing protein n=1 Tax=Companilactobacillus paralimentarius TaxID=83526 RepID=UPI00384D48C5
MSNVLKIEELNYKKGSKIILEDVNLKLDSGKIIGLLGENSAGKTTLMRIIAGVNSVPEGVITVNGNTKKVLIKENVSLNDHLDGFKATNKISEIVHFYDAVYQDFSITKYEDIANFLGLDMTKKLAALSTGTRGKLVIALTLARSTKLYLLDEPLSGIDSISRKKIISSIIRWKDDDSTIIISDHYVTAIASLLDEVVIIKNGEFYNQVSHFRKMTK